MGFKTLKRNVHVTPMSVFLLMDGARLNILG